MGTPAYAAPEQWERPAEAVRHSDIWALGVILYECLVGTKPQVIAGKLPRPFADEMSAAVPSDLPDALRSLVLRCFMPLPDMRPDAESLALELERFIAF